MGNLQLQCQADNQKLVSGNMSICLSLLEIRMQLKVARMQLKVAVASKRGHYGRESRLSCLLETCLLMRFVSCGCLMRGE